MTKAKIPDLSEIRIAVVGLGYVGLPLAVELSKHYPITGFDTDADRIADLTRGVDHTLEVSEADLRAAKALRYTADPQALSDANFYVVTVPTPIDQNKRPDLEPLTQASQTIGKVIGRGNIVVFESTVFPGATEELCAPIIERTSNLVFNVDFFAGYSPERINPGDTEHRLADIVKVTSGSTPETAQLVDALYRSVIPAGTHLASSIKVAEAAKVIENTQRDLNVALVNELALLFEKLDIDSGEVLAAAGTKWNFLPFRPGLVGGHCIGVDPYYLTYKAEEIGYHPEVILAGRRINDQMASHIADRLVQVMTQARIDVVDSRILILGLTFKENCPDIRNTRVVDLIEALKSYNMHVDVYDPWVDAQAAARQYGLAMLDTVPKNAYDAVVLAVAHRQFTTSTECDITQFGKEPHVVFDIKHVLPRHQVTARL